MILGRFRKGNIRKNIKKELLKNNSLKGSAHKKVSSILILLDEDSQENLDQIISDKFNIDVLKVTSIVYKKKQDSVRNFENELIDKNFSLFGKLKNDVIEKLLKTEFDLLVNYINGNLSLNYVTAFSKASFKVGFATNQQQVFDLMIDVEQSNVELFHAELVKYLNILNKI